MVCGRVFDPSLVVGLAMTHHDWSEDGRDRLGRATMVSGGDVAALGYKDMAGLDQGDIPSPRSMSTATAPSSSRSAQGPGVPTMAEACAPGNDMGYWFAA